MLVDMEGAIEPLSKLDLWVKVRENSLLTLADIPELIRLRWPYFRDNWETLRATYLDFVSSYQDPERLRSEIELFTRFIRTERNSKNKKNPFDNKNIIYIFYSIFDSTNINSIALNGEESAIVKSKIEEVQKYIRSDFLNMRSELEIERDAMADKVGLQDDSYNTVYKRSSRPARVDVKNKDMNAMNELMKSIDMINYILANYFSLETASVDPFALAKANANNPDIDIISYLSGTLVKLNYGEDLQSLAQRTLGSPDRWIDIAIANGLKPPYIDEVGQKLFIMSNGVDNKINISGLLLGQPALDLFYVGQPILLQSTTQNFPEQRVVAAIRQIPISDDIILELDGEKDLDRYKVSEGAYVRVYKSNTINSSFFVLIPSSDPLPDDLRSETPWFLKTSDNIEKRQKVDLSINTEGDLVFNSNNDIQPVYGIENSIQAIKLKMSVEQGELIRHKDYGLISVIGDSNIDVDAVRRILVDSIDSAIKADTRFSNIESLNIEYVNSLDSKPVSAFKVKLIVKLAGSDQNIPISFNINI
jgi:hypothetical protein